MCPEEWPFKLFHSMLKFHAAFQNFPFVAFPRSPQTKEDSASPSLGDTSSFRGRRSVHSEGNERTETNRVFWVRRESGLDSTKLRFGFFYCRRYDLNSKKKVVCCYSSQCSAQPLCFSVDCIRSLQNNTSVLVPFVFRQKALVQLLRGQKLQRPNTPNKWKKKQHLSFSPKGT